MSKYHAKEVGIEISKPEVTVIDIPQEELINIFGDPNKISKHSRTETWIYYGSHRFLWRGIIPIIILVPIPLVIPTEYER